MFRNFCFRKKDAIGVNISQKALEFLDCRIPGKTTTVPRKKLHGGVGGIGRPTSSAIGKTRSEIEGVHWGWVLVLANVFHLGLALRCWGYEPRWKRGTCSSEGGQDGGGRSFNFNFLLFEFSGDEGSFCLVVMEVSIGI